MSKLNKLTPRSIISRRVTMYETVDGRQHSTMQQARIHALKLELRAILETVLTAPPYESTGEIEYITDAVCEHPDKIATLLRRYHQLTKLIISKPNPAEPSA